MQTATKEEIELIAQCIKDAEEAVNKSGIAEYALDLRHDLIVKIVPIFIEGALEREIWYPS